MSRERGWVEVCMGIEDEMDEMEGYHDVEDRMSQGQDEKEAIDYEY